MKVTVKEKPAVELLAEDELTLGKLVKAFYPDGLTMIGVIALTSDGKLEFVPLRITRGTSFSSKVVFDTGESGLYRHGMASGLAQTWGSRAPEAWPIENLFLLGGKVLPFEGVVTLTN